MKGAIKSPQSILFSRLNSPSCLVERCASPLWSPLGPPLDSFQQILLMLGAAELDMVLQVASQKARAEWGNHLSWPLVAPLGEAQDTFGFLGFKHTLLGQVELLVNQHSQIFLPRAALKPFFTRPVFCVWDCSNPGSGPCTRLCWTSWGLYVPTSAACPVPSGWHPFPLDGMPSLQSVTHTARLAVIRHLLRVHSVLCLRQVVKQHQSRY